MLEKATLYFNQVMQIPSGSNTPQCAREVVGSILGPINKWGTPLQHFCVAQALCRADRPRRSLDESSESNRQHNQDVIFLCKYEYLSLKMYERRVQHVMLITFVCR